MLCNLRLARRLPDAGAVRIGWGGSPLMAGRLVLDAVDEDGGHFRLMVAPDNGDEADVSIIAVSGTVSLVSIDGVAGTCSAVPVAMTDC